MDVRSPMNPEKFRKKLRKKRIWSTSLEFIDEKHRNMVYDELVKISKKHKTVAATLAKQTPDILEVDDGKYYQTTIETLNQFMNDYPILGQEFANQSAEILSISGKNGYKEVLKSLSKTWRKEQVILPMMLIRYAPEILKIDDGKYYQSVVDATMKLVDNHNYDFYVIRFIGNSTKILERVDKSKEVTEDVLLIEHIETPEDAQIIGPIIDMDKYSDLYNEKVQRFY